MKLSVQLYIIKWFNMVTLFWPGGRGRIEIDKTRAHKLPAFSLTCQLSFWIIEKTNGQDGKSHVPQAPAWDRISMK